MVERCPSPPNAFSEAWYPEKPFSTFRIYFYWHFPPSMFLNNIFRLLFLEFSILDIVDWPLSMEDENLEIFYTHTFTSLLSQL